MNIFRSGVFFLASSLFLFSVSFPCCADTITKLPHTPQMMEYATVDNVYSGLSPKMYFVENEDDIMRVLDEAYLPTNLSAVERLVARRIMRERAQGDIGNSGFDITRESSIVVLLGKMYAPDVVAEITDISVSLDDMKMATVTVTVSIQPPVNRRSGVENAFQLLPSRILISSVLKQELSRLRVTRGARFVLVISQQMTFDQSPLVPVPENEVSQEKKE